MESWNDFCLILNYAMHLKSRATSCNVTHPKIQNWINCMQDGNCNRNQCLLILKFLTEHVICEVHHSFHISQKCESQLLYIFSFNCQYETTPNFLMKLNVKEHLMTNMIN
jgi:hypothetical protein